MRGYLLLAFATGLGAAPLTVSSSGVYSAATPVTLFSAPSASWTFSFNVDSNPAVLSFLAGSFSQVATSSISYTLAGSPVSLSPTFAYLYHAGGGALGVCFDVACVNGLLMAPASPVWGGPESAPTILSGIYPELGLTLGTPITSYIQTPGTVTIAIESAGKTPEPSTLGLCAAALLGLALRGRKRAGT